MMLNLTPWILAQMASILSFEAQSSGIFVGIAQSALGAVGLVLVMMFGLRASQAMEHGQAPQVGGYLNIGLKLAFCFWVAGSWIVPAAGLGSPLGTWIPNSALHLAQLIGWDGAQSVATSVASWSGMEMPGTIFSLGTIYWLMTQIFLFGASVALVLVLVGPMGIMGLLVVIGPLFIPMWILPELTAIARGYLRCLITYSLVPVIAAAAMNLIAHKILPSMSQLSGEVTSVETALPQAFILCLSLVGIVALLFACVRVANHVTSGSSGSGSGWLSAGFTAVRAML